MRQGEKEKWETEGGKKGIRKKSRRRKKKEQKGREEKEGRKGKGAKMLNTWEEYE
jgi:hypothetical protein